jgi:cell division septal protein FtsQ
MKKKEEIMEKKIVESTEAKQTEKENTNNEAILIQVPTEFGIAIKLPDGREITDLQLLVEIYNELSELKKQII